MVNINSAIILIALNLINFGCFSQHMATDKTQIEQDILTYLNDKYNQSFIVKNINWENNVSGKTTDKHFIVLAPEGNPELTFDAKVSYENKNKEFELLFEYYPRVIINAQAQADNKKIIDPFTSNYNLETKLVNTIKLDEQDIPSDQLHYSEILKKNPDKWSTEVKISLPENELKDEQFTSLIFALIKDHMKRHHELLNIHIIKLNNDGKDKNLMLKLNKLQSLNLEKNRSTILNKIMEY